MKPKTRWNNHLWMVTIGVGLMVLPTNYAHAYLDPGSGSFLFQMLVAGFLGFLFVLRLFKDRVSSFFRQQFGRQRSPVEKTTEE